MVYYTMRISPAIQDMTTIVTEFGKFRYNHLLMGICALGYILQSKVDQLLGDIEGIKIYIGDILVLSKYCFLKAHGTDENNIWKFSRIRIKSECS